MGLAASERGWTQTNSGKVAGELSVTGYCRHTGAMCVTLVLIHGTDTDGYSLGLATVARLMSDRRYVFWLEPIDKRPSEFDVNLIRRDRKNTVVLRAS